MARRCWAGLRHWFLKIGPAHRVVAVGLVWPFVRENSVDKARAQPAPYLLGSNHEREEGTHARVWLAARRSHAAGSTPQICRRPGSIVADLCLERGAVLNNQLPLLHRGSRWRLLRVQWALAVCLLFYSPCLLCLRLLLLWGSLHLGQPEFPTSRRPEVRHQHPWHAYEQLAGKLMHDDTQSALLCG